jgi:hypothetical protein
MIGGKLAGNFARSQTKSGPSTTAGGTETNGLGGADQPMLDFANGETVADQPVANPSGTALFGNQGLFT